MYRKVWVSSKVGPTLCSPQAYGRGMTDLGESVGRGVLGLNLSWTQLWERDEIPKWNEPYESLPGCPGRSWKKLEETWA